jgi:Type I phosphodiesterase / nucleotide pyrophosphatase
MARVPRYVLTACLVLALAPAAWAAHSRNVVLIVCDGLRWQEIFTGADPLLINEQAGGSWSPEAELRSKYWADDAVVRRRLLFPFIWDTLATHGQLFGNQAIGSKVYVTNTMWFSYPGYNEMTSGINDPAIQSNAFPPNPNVTVFEWLNSLPEYHGKVELFGTWGAFHRIFSEARSGLPIRAGYSLVDAGDQSPRGRLMNELYQTTTRLEEDNPPDSVLHVVLREHLQKAHPRILFVGYGDTDLWQHLGRYDAFLETAHSFDKFVHDLWDQMQSMPEYRNQTTFLITADHGRGSGAINWKDHGVAQPGSANIWLGVLGPDTAPLGERRNVPDITQSQIASTIAAFVGQDFRAFKPAAAKSAIEAMGPGLP